MKPLFENASKKDPANEKIILVTTPQKHGQCKSIKTI